MTKKPTRSTSKVAASGRNITKGTQSAKENAAGAAASPDWKPECIYFYYLKPKSDHHADVLSFMADMKMTIGDGDVLKLVERFIAEVRSEVYVHLVPLGHFFEDVTWTRQSYLVIVVDDERYTLSKNDIQLLDSHHTITKEEEIRSPLFPEVSGVSYQNRIVRRGGGKWNKDKHEKEEYEIEIEFKPNPTFIKIKPMSHEDSGTNLGPPIPPP